MTVNQNTSFTINLKNIDAEYERKLTKDPEDKTLNFDPANPEGKYCLDLSEAFNQVVLQLLLQTAEKAVEENPGAFELKKCFDTVTFNGKTKWDPPVEKDSNNLFMLGEEPSGILKFNFTMNPAALKETEKQIRKLTEAGDLKQVEAIRKEQAKPAENINVTTITKGMSSDKGANNFFDMIVERYKEEDE